MRRGQNPVSTVLTMILLVLVLLLSVGIIIIIRNSMANSDDSQCKEQVIASSLAVKYSKNLGAPTIKCPTKLLSATADSANQVIADQMKQCWDNWGKGQLPLFGDTGGIYCHVCSSITIDGPVSGLGQYLDTHKATDTQTYSQYLTLTTTGDYFKDEKGQPLASATFTKDKPVGIIFKYAKGQTFIKQLQNDILGQPETGAAAGLVIGVMITGAAFTLPAVTVMAGTTVAGGAASIWTRNDLSTAAIVYARPMTVEDINKTGCKYAPVKN